MTEHRAPITIVTAFFALDKSNAPHPDGRTQRDYHKWMANFLPVIKWPLVIFCDEESLDIIKRLRGSRPAVYHIIRWDEFSVYRHRRMLRAHIAQCWPGFPADLSLVYHEKVNFVRRAIDENTYQSEMFFWSDICRFRQPKGQAVFHLSERIEWPNLQVCRAEFGNQVAFFATAFVVHDPAPSPWVLGTIWGGRAKPVRRFCDDYYRFLDSRIRKNPAATEPVPGGMRYHTEEEIFNLMSESGDFTMRVFTTGDIRWLRGLERLASAVVGLVRSGSTRAPNFNPQSLPPPPPPPAESSDCSLALHGALLRVHVLLPERRTFSVGVSRQGSFHVCRRPPRGKYHPPASRSVAAQNRALTAAGAFSPSTPLRALIATPAVPCSSRGNA